MDTILCDVIDKCEECPRYGDDCDGDKRIEPTDLIKREDAVKTVIRKCSPICAWQVGTQQYPDCVVAEINALPSAELTLQTPQTYGKSINPSAEAKPKWNCTANFAAEQLDRLRKMTDEERWDFLIRFFSPSADTVSREFYEDAVKANIRLVIENRELKEQIESAEAEWIPVSERLPNEYECGWYLVTVKGHELFVDVAPFNYELWEGLASHQKVIAWMPLPKPYREDGEK